MKCSGCDLEMVKISAKIVQCPKCNRYQQATPSRSLSELSFPVYRRKVQYLLEGREVERLTGAIRDRVAPFSVVRRIMLESWMIGANPSDCAIEILTEITQLFIKERREDYATSRDSRPFTLSHDQYSR